MKECLRFVIVRKDMISVMKKFRIVLASASPRRSEIMNQVNIDFEVIPSNCEEVITKTKPSDVVKELCYQKALSVFNEINEENVIVVGADTIVANEDKILGKPKSKEEAYDMINSIQGTSHYVYTGVCLVGMFDNKIVRQDMIENILKGIDAVDSKYKDYSFKNTNDKAIIEICFYEKTKVNVNSMSDEQIKEYIDTDEPYDKAGGYGIQGLFAKHISGIQGDYYNVMGLPIASLNEKIEIIKRLIK